MIFNHKINENCPTIEVCGTTLVPVHTVKYLGVHLDLKLNFKNHAQKMKMRAIARPQHFRGLTYKNQGISQRTAAHIYKMLCRPINEYGYLLFRNVSNSTKKKIEMAETTCLRRITKLRHPRNSI
jgi:hypothetical protein